MKKIFKGLSTVALSLMLGLNVTNVEAATSCPAGTTEHTNYYLFINENTADYFETKLESATHFGAYNSTQKFNNIQKQDIIDDGNVGITRNGETTSNGSAKTWTVQEYWNKFRETASGMNSDFVYTSGNTSYFLHGSYSVYETDNFTGGNKVEDKSLAANLTNIANLVRDDLNTLSTSGTNLPATTINRPTSLATSSDKLIEWYITRDYKVADKATGVTIGGQKMVYSPAVYFVTFCDSGSTSTDKVTLTYDSNTTDSVTGMPTPTTVTKDKTACEKINSARPVRTGYTFVGWSTTKGENNTADSNFAPGSGQYCESTNLTLYAVWSKNGGTPNPSGSYKVYYDANGGKDAPKTDESTNNSCVTISSQKPVQSGNNFLGWSREKGAREADPKYAAGKEYCGENGDITLYAVWGTQTGISAHLIAFAAVAMGAGAALIVAKKKNLFKQI